MIDAIVNPWLLVPATIMTALFYVMRMIFINAGRSFVRVESLGELKIEFRTKFYLDIIFLATMSFFSL